MTFQFSHQSQVHLIGVCLELRRVALRALQISEVDFALIDGLRTHEEEAENVRKGASRTMDSRHLTGHAIDIIPYVDGRRTFAECNYPFVAEAFKAASIELNIPIVWGACWDKRLDQITECAAAPAEYSARRRSMGKKAFIDWGHFELHRQAFP